MKKIFGIAMAIIFVGVLTFTSCQKEQIQQTDTWRNYFVDSIGYKHNDILKSTINKIKNKKNVSREEIYDTIVKIAVKKYNLDYKEIPKFQEISDEIDIFIDTTTSCSEKFKTLVPNCSEKQLEYITNIENVLKNAPTDSIFRQNTAIVEYNIKSDPILTNLEKGDLLNLTDVAKYSFVFWMQEKNIKEQPYPNGWWVVAADAIAGAVGYLHFGPSGALVLAVVISVYTAMEIIDLN